MAKYFKGLIIIGAALMIGFGASAQSVSQNDTIVIDRILAVVGAHPILQSDLEQAILTRKAQGMRIEGDENCTVLEELMQNKLYLDQAELDSIEKTDREVEIALERKLNAFVRMAGSEEAIEKQFNKSMPEIKKDFFEDMKEQLLTEEIQFNLTDDIKITPSEVKKFFRDIPENEITEDFIRSSGPGGQNVNKVSTAVQLRFDVKKSPSLPDGVRRRLIRLAGSRLTKDGILVIRAERHRTREQNRKDAVNRLADLIVAATKVPKYRVKTKPSKASRIKRLETKQRRGQLKKRRGKVSISDY